MVSCFYTRKRAKWPIKPTLFSGCEAVAWGNFTSSRWMLVHRRVTPSIKFASTIHLHTWVERDTVRVKHFYPRIQQAVPDQDSNPTNHEATMSSLIQEKSRIFTESTRHTIEFLDHRNAPPRTKKITF